MNRRGPKIVAWKRALPCRLAVAFAFAATLAGCSSTTAIDKIPAWAGGEPEGTPPRLANQMEYPPVHDRPPKPATRVVTVEEQTKTEKELAAARDAQAKRAEQMKKDRALMLANKPKPAVRPATEETPSY